MNQRKVEFAAAGYVMVVVLMAAGWIACNAGCKHIATTDPAPTTEYTCGFVDGGVICFAPAP